jgi:hypothetical protein
MRKPSSEYFVVKPGSGGTPAGVPMEKVGSTGLYLFRSSTPVQGAQDEWERLRQSLGDQVDFISPVMVDEQGRQTLPTGKIVVQFHEPPSQPSIRRIESTYGLRYLDTNEFKPAQVTFEVQNHQAAYPPDLVANLEKDADIKLAVPETLARFSRA